MGHERIGTLPKSEKWKGIVKSISNYTAANEAISEIALQTTKNVRHRFQYIEGDGGVFAAFKYVLALAYAAKSEDSFDRLIEQGIDLPNEFNLYDLAYSIQEYVSQNSDSKEYSAFAIKSIIDTISEWAQKNESNQTVLFDTNNKGFELWYKASTGAGFCEISRLFFSKFTEQYLKYFLEREAAAQINNLYDRTQFNKTLKIILIGYQTMHLKHLK